MKVLFLGDVFGEPGVKALEKHLQKILIKEKIDFCIAQGENVSGRKGLTPEDYNRLKKAGVDAFTMGNHVWAKESIKEIIGNNDIIRPYNVDPGYLGKGSAIFKVKGRTLRISQFMGIGFNDLYTGWNQKNANNFFDAFDKLSRNKKTDFHIIDFHAETTSEKKVFGLYVDGKVNAFVGTHTHIQTSDAHTLPKGTAYITDAGMTGPEDCAIGASFDTVYRKMRYNEKVKFEVSENNVKLNGVIITMNKSGNTIKNIEKALR